MKDKDKRPNGQRNYIFRKGKMIEQTGLDQIPMTEMLRALAAKKPFMKLTEAFMIAIGESLQENQNTLPPEDTLKLPVGAMAYILAHYYVYLSRVATVEESNKFLADFSEQTRLAMEIFIAADKKDRKNKKDDKGG